ncbi:hypothetical protein C475_12290 [Halosimplex carlsbadense 2-9-1]|uniref:DUF2270 domain-containing protein n=1 Tax=Halosimplex carlsbadense 2-9-1 TaxID=797114 RepID=M0CPI4_9EURY|nr:DUF2270 domain-containing protein [Halosimplex carlsbadense]ELZ24518.1 hypothetical protein C475_12290 [Halosimplex carlsbadense 2-9-1]
MDEGHSDSPLDRGDEEIAAEIAGDTDALLAALPHFYRGEVSQANSAQNRIDRTTTWAITLIAALLSVVFAGPAAPAYLLLIGVGALAAFLSYEVRRYRFYDLHRSRVRLVQENVFANALSPEGAEHADWREELSRDLRYPTFKVSALEALSRRLRRTYGLLFAVVGAAWVAKVTLFTPENRWTEAAELPGVPGAVVAGALAVCYIAVLALAVWPIDRRAKGEVHGERVGEWKDE